MTFGPGDPWSRPVRGFTASVESISLEDLAPLHERIYHPGERLAAGVGALSDTALSATLGLEPGSAARSPEQRSRAAWDTGGRRVVTREITSSWVGLAFPVAPELSRMRLEFLAYALEERLIREPPDPGVFGAWIEIRSGPAGDVLQITGALFPDDAARWESRVLEAVESLRSGAPDRPAFRLSRRRFRSVRLMEVSSPEGAARQMVRDLFRGYRPRDLAEEISRLEPSDLQTAARGLGPPRILVFGPDLSENGAGAGEP